MLAIPTTPCSVCEALFTLNQATWSELGTGILTWQRLAEESVTDYNLMRLAAAAPVVIIEKHTKPQEALSGADWEMWFGRPGSYIGFRVQAKLLQSDTGRYEHLFETKETATRQADDLIVSALSGKWPTYPLYSFYNHYLPTGTGPTRSPCPTAGSAAVLHGWTVASALAAPDILRAAPSKRAADFEHLAYPIQCLVCCPPDCSKHTAARGTVAQSIDRRIRDLWHRYTRLNVDSLVHGVAPVYVERMYKGERPQDGWREANLPVPPARYLPEDLSRVVLIREELPSDERSP